MRVKMRKLKNLRERICALTAAAALLLTTVLPAIPASAEEPVPGGGEDSAAQIEYTLYVADKGSNALSGVTVAAEISGDSESRVEDKTDHDGYVTLILNENTEYTVTASKDGYVQEEECYVTPIEGGENYSELFLNYRTESIKQIGGSADTTNWTCGDQAVFSVTSASADGELSYEWIYDSNCLKLIKTEGATAEFRAVGAGTSTICAVNSLGQYSNEIEVTTVKKPITVALSAEATDYWTGINKEYPTQIKLTAKLEKDIQAVCDTEVVFYQDNEEIERVVIPEGQDTASCIYEERWIISGERNFKAVVTENQAYDQTESNTVSSNYGQAPFGSIDAPATVSGDFDIIITPPNDWAEFTYSYVADDNQTGIIEKLSDEKKDRGKITFSIDLDEKELEEAEKPLSVTFTFTREKIWTMDSATETVKVNVIPAMEIAGEDLKAETSYSPSGQKITDIFPELGEYATDYTVFKYSCDSDKVEINEDTGEFITKDITGKTPVKITVSRVEKDNYDKVVDSVTCELTINKQEVDLDPETVSVNIDTEKDSKIYDGKNSVPSDAFQVTGLSEDMLADSVGLQITARTEEKDVRVDSSNTPAAQQVTITDIKLTGDEAGKYSLDNSVKKEWIESVNAAESLTFTIDPKVLTVEVKNQEVVYGPDTYSTITYVDNDNRDDKYKISGYVNEEGFDDAFAAAPSISIPEEFVDSEKWVKQGEFSNILSIETTQDNFENYNYKFEEKSISKGDLEVGAQKINDILDYASLDSSSGHCWFDGDTIWAKTAKEDEAASQDGESYTEEGFNGAELVMSVNENAGYNTMYYEGREITAADPLVIDKNERGTETYKVQLKRIVDGEEFASADAKLNVSMDNSSPKVTSSLKGVTKAVSQWAEIITFGFGDYASDNQIIKADITFADYAEDSMDPESAGSGVASIEYKSVKITQNGFNEADIKSEALSETGYQTIEDISAGHAEVILGEGTKEDIEEGNYILFVRAADNVGNGCIYVSTGAVYDYTVPSVKIVRDEQPTSVNGTLPVYDKDIKVTVYANDFVQNSEDFESSSDTASGVKSIAVTVTSTDAKGNVKETKESWTTELGDTPSLAELLEENKSLSEKGFSFSVDSTEHNSNNIKVTAVVTDRAGKVVTKDSEYMAIDTTAPEVSYTYDNNSAQNGVYYKADRTASVTVKERNFVNDLGHLYIAVKEKNQTEYSRYTYADLQKGYLPGVSVSNYHDGQADYDVTAYDDNRTITFDLTFSGDNEYDWYCYVEDTNGKSAQTEPDFFVLDKTAPVLKNGGVKYYVDGKDVTAQAENGSLFTSKEVKAVVSIDETNFAAEGSGFADGQMAVNLIAADNEGNNVDVTEKFIDAMTSADSWSNWDEKNGLTREMSMTFGDDANYQFGFTYTDLAGNSVTYNARRFTHDHTNPTGSVTYDTNAGKETWRTFFDLITFNRFKQTEVPVTFTGEDMTAGVKSIEYYKAYEPMSYEEIEALPSRDWTSGTSFTVRPNEQFVPYLKVTDKADNTEYFSSEFAVVADNTQASPEIRITAGNPSNGIYNSSVPFHISVTDPTSGNTYAGLQSVYYEVRRDGQVTQSGNYDSALQPASRRVKNIERDEVVDAQLNNSNDVEIYVRAVDNAGNVSEASQELSIDITEPTIQVTYDLNSPLNDRYYNATRTATVVVTERNFDESAVRFDITNTDGTQPSISGWSHSSDSGVSDSATHTCRVTFSADGDYTFTLNTTDLAGNDSNYTRVDEFTIDQTDPTIQVSYDNNNDAVAGYYNAERTATITINEHNFNASEVNAQITARLQNRGVSAPGIGGWSTRGDVHTASVTFSADADYTFDVDYTDLAGNAAADYDQDSFTIDQTDPEIEFFDIEDKSANKDTVAPGVSYSDINYDENGVKITIEGAEPDHSEEAVDGRHTDIPNGESIKMADFEHTEDNDDVYTMTAEITDRAGNTTEESIVFSVNRFGSTYVFSDETREYLAPEEGDEYIYTNEPQDIEVTERNVDTLVNNGIFYGRDGELVNLEEGTDYTVRESGSDVSWKEYRYDISKDNFEQEGHYTVTIDSEDRAENLMNNQTKGLDIEFVVDKTAPSVVITGIEEDAYTADTRDMVINVTDNTAAKQVEVLIGGQVVETFDQEMIQESGGKLTYTINSSSSPQLVEAVAVDKAGNEAVSEAHTVLVSANLFVQYINNTPLLIGSIILLLVIAGAVCYIVIIRKRREQQK